MGSRLLDALANDGMLLDYIPALVPGKGHFIVDGHGVVLIAQRPEADVPDIQIQVPQHSFADGLAVIENRIRDDMLDERLLQLTDYVRNFWMARVGIATLSAFKMVRRTNNSCEIFHTKLLLALGRRKNVWSFVRGLQGVEQDAFCDLERLINNIPVRRPPSIIYARNTANVQDAMTMLSQGEITLESCLRRLAHVQRDFPHENVKEVEEVQKAALAAAPV